MRKILLIDPNENDLKHSKAVIDWESRDFTVSAAFSRINRALEEISDIAPAIVITDLGQPLYAGTELLSTLHRAAPTAPIAVLTAHDQADWVREAYKHGVFRYMIKPANAADIHEMLDAFDEITRRGGRTADDRIPASVKDIGIAGHIQEYVDENFVKHGLSLKALAEHFHLNYSYVSFLFKKQTGKTFSAYVRERRIRQAEWLLSQTAMPMSYIAQATGFQNAQVLYYAFRKATGKTPKACRLEAASKEEHLSNHA